MSKLPDCIVEKNYWELSYERETKQEVEGRQGQWLKSRGWFYALYLKRYTFSIVYHSGQDMEPEEVQ